MGVITWSDDEKEDTDQPEFEDEEKLSRNIMAFTGRSTVQSYSGTEGYESSDDFEERQSQLEKEHTKLLAKWDIFLKENRTLNGQIQIYEDSLKKLNVEISMMDDLINHI